MVTQEQIARKLGVSRQLVTLALRGYPKVSKDSRERILAAAREMGYSPNPHAHALRRDRIGIIALWIPDQISTYYYHVSRQLSRLLKKAHYELVIREVGSTDPEHLMSRVPVDGVIAVGVTDQTRDLMKKSTHPLPLVSMGSHCLSKADAVQVDLLAGTRDAMRHLLDAGFRRIAHATFIQSDKPHAARRFGYLEAMRKADLEPEFIYYPLTQDQRPITRQLIKNYIKQHGCPEAIFCHSDDAALGIHRGLCDLSLRVPGDVALVGCDGIEDVEYLETPLTSVAMPVEEMCAASWKLLQERLERPGRKFQKVVFKPKLIVRESSRRTARNKVRTAFDD